MRAVVIYKERSDHRRAVEDFLHYFTSVTGRELETVDPETRDGVGFCETYDIVQYPTVIALSDEGRVLNLWAGTPLPTVDEVSYYA